MDNIIFGLRPVIEAIRSGKEIEKLYIRKGAEGGLIGDLRQMAREAGIRPQEVPEQRLERFTRGNHQGVVALMAEAEYAEAELFLEMKESDPNLFIVALDGITDVRNFGAIARSAECAGAAGILISSKNGAPVNGDAIRTSAGALTRIPVARTGGLRNSILGLRNEGFRIIGASEKADASIYDTDLKGPCVFVMGSEEKGISREILKICDATVSIPMLGKIGSLNVSAAAAVVLYESVRQRISTGK